jgi:hypothetical protein
VYLNYRNEERHMEEYRDIPNYLGLYQISNLGNVKSLPKRIGGKERLLKQEIVRRDHTNYRRVTLSKDGITQRFQVHRLVAQAFIDNPLNKPQVNHLDNNGENNCSTNLEWATGSENMIHAQKQGRLDKAVAAGVVASVAAQQKLTAERHANLIGQRFHNLTLSHIWLNPDMEYTYYATAVCELCGHSCSKSLTEIVNGRKSAQQCNDCTQQLRTKQLRASKIAKLIGAVKHNHRITDACWNDERGVYMITVECNLCTVSKNITLSHFNDKRYKLTCCN